MYFISLLDSNHWLDQSVTKCWTTCFVIIENTSVLKVSLTFFEFCFDFLLLPWLNYALTFSYYRGWIMLWLSLITVVELCFDFLLLPWLNYALTFSYYCGWIMLWLSLITVAELCFDFLLLPWLNYALTFSYYCRWILLRRKGCK